MNKFATWFFAVLAIVLLGFALVYKPLVGSTRDRRGVGGLALEIDPGAVQRIEITRGGETILLINDGTGWRLDKPIQDSASVEEIQKLLTLAANLRILDMIPESEFKRRFKNGPFGFSPAINRLKMKTPRGEQEILFGAEAVGGGRVYIRTGKSRDTMVVADDLLNQVLLPTERFRDPRLANFPAHLVERVRLKSPRGTLVLERVSTEWKITEPFSSLANTAAFDEMLERFLGARVFEFLAAPNENPMGDAGDAGSVELWLEGENKSRMFQLLSSDEGPYVLVRNPARGDIQRIARTNAEIFEAKLGDLRDLRVLSINPDIVDLIKVRTDEQNLIIERSNGGWAGVKESRISPELATRFFELLSTLQAERFVPLSNASSTSPALFAKPELEILLQSRLSENTPEDLAGTIPIARLAFVKSLEGEVLVRVNEGPEALVVTPESLQEFFDLLSHSAHSSHP
jgi:hypothetical protein